MLQILRTAIKTWRQNRSDYKGFIVPARKIPDRLSEFCQMLDDVCKSAEPDFISLGRNLESLFSDVTVLSERIMDTVREIGRDSGENPFSRVGAIARSSLSKLNNCHSDIHTDLQYIEGIIHNLDKLRRVSAGVEKIAMFFRLLGFNIAIESSRAAETTDMFQVVSEQIHQLSSKVTGIIGGIQEEALKTHNSQTAAFDQIAKDLNRLRNLTNDADRTVETSLLEIERIMELSIEALERAARHTENISRQVGEIVVGIQIHDSMTQGIANMIEVIDDAVQIFTGHRNNRKYPPDRYSHLSSVISFQRIWLKESISTILNAYEKSTAAFNKISVEIDMLGESLSGSGLVALGECGHSGSADVDDPFPALASALSRLKGIIDEVNSLIEGINTSASEASDTADRLSESMSRVAEISSETHIIALNAIVKAAHLGEQGRALEVLAQEVKKLSDQTNEFSAGVKSLLDNVSTSVDELRSRVSDEPRNNEETSGAEIDTGIEDIAVVYKRYQKKTGNVCRQTGGIKEEININVKRISFLLNLADEFDNLIRYLDGICIPNKLKPALQERHAAAIEPPADEETCYIETEEKSGLLTEERQIDIINAPSLLPDHSKKDKMELISESSNSDDDFGDNVELF
ncbi:methyl-accepting chemotaxis protein [Desulfobacterales bacterium HSG16]|nr:methyl-accepting chemotaxis protein [Desulfobacterales bacterium HSG16]